jgi:hypothetical protein
MSEPDIRWQQRLANYTQALTPLGNAVKTHNHRPLSELEKQGLIQAFEFMHEKTSDIFLLLTSHLAVRFQQALMDCASLKVAPQMRQTIKPFFLIN